MKCLVVASGHTVWKDLEAYGWMPQPTDQSAPVDVMAVNDMIIHFPGRLKHAYTNDWKMLMKWVNARRPRYVRNWHENIKLHTCRMGVHGAIESHKLPGTGTSSMNALIVAVRLGYDEIVGLGMPMDNGPHYFDPPWVKTNFENECRDLPDGEIRYWSNAFQKHFEGKVRIMSGRLAEWAVKNGYQSSLGMPSSRESQQTA